MFMLQYLYFLLKYRIWISSSIARYHSISILESHLAIEVRICNHSYDFALCGGRRARQVKLEASVMKTLEMKKKKGKEKSTIFYLAGLRSPLE